jgi:hypothetical protein
MAGVKIFDDFLHSAAVGSVILLCVVLGSFLIGVIVICWEPILILTLSASVYLSICYGLGKIWRNFRP